MRDNYLYILIKYMKNVYNIEGKWEYISNRRVNPTVTVKYPNWRCGQKLGIPVDNDVFCCIILGKLEPSLQFERIIPRKLLEVKSI